MLRYQLKQASNQSSGPLSKYAKSQSQFDQLPCQVCGKWMLKRTMSRHHQRMHKPLIIEDSDAEEVVIDTAIPNFAPSSFMNTQAGLRLLGVKENQLEESKQPQVMTGSTIDTAYDFFNYPEPQVKLMKFDLMLKDHWNLSQSLLPFTLLEIPDKSVSIMKAVAILEDTADGLIERKLNIVLMLQPEQLLELRNMVYNTAYLSLLNKRYGEVATEKMPEKYLKIFNPLKATVFQSYLNGQLRKSFSKLFHSFIDEYNCDVSEQLSYFKVLSDIQVDVFEFLKVDKFPVVEFNTSIVWKPGKFQRNRKSKTLCNPSRHAINSTRALTTQGVRIAMILQSLVNFFVDIPCRPQTSRFMCLNILLDKWLKENKSMRSVGYKCTKASRLLAVARELEDQMWVLLDPKAVVIKSNDAEKLERKVYPDIEDQVIAQPKLKPRLQKQLDKAKKALNLPDMTAGNKCKPTTTYYVKLYSKELWVYDCSCRIHKLHF